MLGEEVARAAGVAEATPQRERIELAADARRRSRCAAAGRRDAHGRLVRAAPGRDPRDRGARGPGPGRALRRALRPAAPDRRRRSSSSGNPCGRGIPTTRSARRRPRARPTGCRRCCRSARSRENIAAPALQQRAPLGAVDMRDGAPARAARDRRALDRHARAAPGAPALGRQPAEGDDRPLARERVPDAALLRPDAGHRRRHEAPDLRAAAAARRRRRSHSPVHERAGRDPARLRPRRLPLRRRGDRRARRRRRRRGDASAGDARARGDAA